MRIDFDPTKRHWTIETRGLDFADAGTFFEGDVIDILDDRVDYGETRYISVGQLLGRMIVVVWTPRGDMRRIISMRKANEREQARYRERLGPR